jgi:uncharacterized protein (PEP-CTERM system associated)
MPCRFSKIYKVAYQVSLLYFVALQTSVAARFDLEPKIELRGIYSDNIGQDAKILKDEDFATIITPGLSLSNSSRRADINLDYSLQNIIYANMDDENKSDHYLNLNIASKIIRELLFLDIDVRNRPQNTSITSISPTDNITISDNLSNVFNYSINPYVKYERPGFLKLNLDYDRNEILSRNNDSVSDHAIASLTNRGYTNSLVWELKYDRDKTTYTGSDSSKFEYADVGLGYILSRTIEATVVFGYENNEFNTAVDKPIGVYWNAGFIFTPSSRTTLEFRAGEKFFGTDVYARVNHRSKRTQFLFTYSQMPSTTRIFLLDQTVFNLVDAFGNQVINPVITSPTDLNTGNPGQTSEVFINNRLTAAFNYKLTRNYFSVDVFNNYRDYQLTGTTENSHGGRFGWEWRPGKKTSTEINLYYNRDKFRNGIRDELSRIDGRVLYKFDENFTFNTGLSYSHNNSNIDTREFSEYRIYSGINKHF